MVAQSKFVTVVLLWEIFQKNNIQEKRNTDCSTVYFTKNTDQLATATLLTALGDRSLWAQPKEKYWFEELQEIRNNEKQPPEVRKARKALKKVILRNLAKFKEAFLCQNSFFNKVAGLEHLFYRTPLADCF